MIVDPVTSRYATALYQLSRRKGTLDAVARDLDALAAEVARPATRGLLFNPRVEREAKRAQLAPLTASMHAFTRNLVNLLLDKNREEVFKGLAAGFKRLALEERGEVEGVVESPRPLDTAEISRLAAAVGRRLGKRMILTTRIAPELVGGVRVIAANRMIDASVQGRLESLRRRMMDVRLPSTPPVQA